MHAKKKTNFVQIASKFYKLLQGIKKLNLESSGIN